MRDSRARFADALAIAVGMLTTLVVSGYQFGRGNHTVYLLEGLRLNRPELFQHDWFITSTLQYHAVFSWLSALLMRLHVIEPAFLVGYLLLIFFWHVAWQKWTTQLGGGRLTYLVSILFFYLSAGGISLGVFQFLQDGCFLPSNVSNVAMLWGFYFLAIDRRRRAGLWLGVAGLFHLNYAVVAVIVWCVVIAWDFTRLKSDWRSIFVGSLLALGPSLFNIGMALEVKLRASGSIPLDEFVQIYVRFRHTHHFDPLAWPIELWIAFLWPIPIAIWFWIREKALAHAEEIPGATDPQVLSHAAKIISILLTLQLIAFFFAGVWFVSESLVQMMLWRFSIFIKLLTCIVAAVVICEKRWLGSIVRRIAIIGVPLAIAIAAVIAFTLVNRANVSDPSVVVAAIRDHRSAIILFTLLSFAPMIALHWKNVLPSKAVSIGTIAACAIVAIAGWNCCLGFGMTPEKVDADYLDVCHWARSNTPVDAIFLVPPSDTMFRLNAERAIVVNFKHVPQLSGEIIQWLHRLQDVLGTQDVRQFPRDYVKMQAALDAKYDGRSDQELITVAEKYDARFIVIDHAMLNANAVPTYRSSGGRYFVYDLRP